MAFEGLVCVGCQTDGGGGFSAADYIAAAGALIGAVGAYAGIQAFIISDRSLRASITRDEFAGHRHVLETAMSNIEAHLVGLRSTLNPAMPLARVDQNFREPYNDVSRAVGLIADEADKIAARGLFKGSWNTSIRGLASRVEREYDTVLDEEIPEGIRRASTRDLVVALDLLLKTTRTLVDDTVKAPLLEGALRWPRKRPQ